MDKGYKINQIARLFGLHPDTLRYYEEQGLVNPQRLENGYRCYTVQDICSLSIVRNLRSLNIPVDRIANYIANREISKTISLLEEEQQLIDRRIVELTRFRETVVKRREELECAGEAVTGELELVSLPTRKCYRLDTPRLSEPEVDVELRRLQQSTPELAKLVGARRMAAVVDMQAVEKGRYDCFQAVLFLDEQFADSDSVLAEGLYARVFYRGGYVGLAKALPLLLEYAKKQGVSPAGDAVELYHVDVHDTRLESEYLTEVQLPLSPS